MEFWEFLIQKEGDRSWLPLESPDVEVLEGRYRMVARTSRVRQSVEIRISHIRLDEHPPRRRTQKRTSQTSPDGLTVVFPFTRLQPGVWELSCAGELLADMLGQGWRYAVQLRVLPHESEVADDWMPDAPAEDTFPAGFVPDFTVDQSDADAPPLEPVEPPVQSPESALPQPVNHAAADLWQKAPADSDDGMDSPQDLSLGSDMMDDGVPPSEEEAEIAAAAVPFLGPDTLQLVLHQSNLMVQPGRSLTLSGVIEAIGELESPYLPPVALQIILRDPQTASTVLEVRRSLISRLLPCPFSCQIKAPETPQTRLLTGEIALVTLATPTNEPTILVSQNFLVTASLNALLEAIANDFPADLYPPLREDDSPADLDLTFLTTPQQPASGSFPRPAGQQILPPQLYQPDPLRQRPKGLELPLTKAIEPPPEVTVEPIAPESVPDEAGEAATDSLEVPAAMDTADQPETFNSDLEEADMVLQHLEAAESDRPAQADANLAASAEDLAFRALDLQNRFLSRLNALAGDHELSRFLGDRPLTPTESDWDAQEIVVDDDLPPPPLRSSMAFQTTPSQPVADPDLLPAEDPLPTPELRVMGGELVSGQRVDVTVILPSTASRLGVKLWMQDLQNRVLLDGPRWLMNFLPNGQGKLEAWTTLTVPHGCLEVQFEAIAVELTSQRESHKITIERSVIPPDLPSLSFDELEI